MVRKDFEWNPRKAYLMFSSPTSGTSSSRSTNRRLVLLFCFITNLRIKELLLKPRIIANSKIRDKKTNS